MVTMLNVATSKKANAGTGAGILDLINLRDMTRLWGVGLLLVALEENEVDTVNNVVDSLSAKFPTINDMSIFEEIGELIASGDYAVEVAADLFEVNVPEVQLRAVLERLDTTGIEDEVEALVEELI